MNNTIEYCFLLNSNFETIEAYNFERYINSEQHKYVPQKYLNYEFDYIGVIKKFQPLGPMIILEDTLLDICNDSKLDDTPEQIKLSS